MQMNNIKKKTYVKASCRVYNYRSFSHLCASSLVDLPISETGTEEYDARGQVFFTQPDSLWGR